MEYKKFENKYIGNNLGKEGELIMKILHLGDLHIGKKVKEFNLIEDQKYVIDQLIEFVERNIPNVVVISGDLYDRAIPPVEAIEVVNGFLNKIVLELKIPVIAIAGNHDSGARLDFASTILEKQGLYIEGKFKSDITKVTINDEFGPVNFYLLPYADPAEVRELYEDENIKTHDDAMKSIIDRLSANFNREERNVAVAHGFITYMKDGEDQCGLELSESERPLSIGGTDKVSAQYFEMFNYTALGHLHGAQKVGSDKIRYAGSPIKYSFSEVKQKKSFTIVNMDDKGEVLTELQSITPLRDMRVIQGPLEKLISKDVYESEDINVEDYIKVILQDEEELIDPLGRLRSVYKNLMEIEIQNKRKLGDNKTAASEGFKEKSEMELFKEFYENISGESLEGEELKIIEDTIKEVLRDEVV